MKKIWAKIGQHPNFWLVNYFLGFWIIILTFVCVELQIPKDFRNGIYSKIDADKEETITTIEKQILADHRDIIQYVDDDYAKKEVIYSMLDGMRAMRNDP